MQPAHGHRAIEMHYQTPVPDGLRTEPLAFDSSVLE
jgi:hypothetical protein